ncbi:MAG: hypothetical protein E6Q68_02645 [Polynucleobacter sp.]|nr:MAG: hypothetical protein E6Q68_02645 [Polynucleobacter sp.]
MYCIKELNISFEVISDDLIKIIDSSDFTFNDISDLSPENQYKLQIKTPQKEVFEVNIAPGMGGVFSLKQNDLCDFVDGIYQVSAITCAGTVLTKNVASLIFIKKAIDNLLLISQNEDYFIILKDQLEIVLTLYKYGKENEAEAKYSDIFERISGCLPQELERKIPGSRLRRSP